MRIIALLKGINVGGNNVIKMADLKDMCVALGATNVKTYVQSGNVVCDVPQADRNKFSTRIEQRLADYGIKQPRVMVLDASAMAASLDNAPFDQDITDASKTLFIHFLWQMPMVDVVTAYEARSTDQEQIKAAGDCFYSLMDRGYFSRSQMSKSSLLKVYNVDSTVRNRKTVSALIELAKG